MIGREFQTNPWPALSQQIPLALACSPSVVFVEQDVRQLRAGWMQTPTVLSQWQRSLSDWPKEESAYSRPTAHEETQRPSQKRREWAKDLLLTRARLQKSVVISAKTDRLTESGHLQ